MKKLTITVEDEVYKGLYAHIGRGNISGFLNNAARMLMKEEQSGAEGAQGRGAALLNHMTEKSGVRMTTDEIMRLTRDA
ncbi:MAG: hypothetical protein ABW189_06890 [Rickettsiales bacterium]